MAGKPLLEIGLSLKSNYDRQVSKNPDTHGIKYEKRLYNKYYWKKNTAA